MAKVEKTRETWIQQDGNKDKTKDSYHYWVGIYNTTHIGLGQGVSTGESALGKGS